MVAVILYESHIYQNIIFPKKLNFVIQIDVTFVYF